MKQNGLIVRTNKGLYCQAGDFYVDPWQPVDRAVITHAHADHAYRGCGNYLAARAGWPVWSWDTYTDVFSPGKRKRTPRD